MRQTVRRHIIAVVLLMIAGSTAEVMADVRLDGYEGETNNNPPNERAEQLFRGDLTPEMGIGCSDPSGTLGGPNDVAIGVTASLTPPLSITSHYYNIFTNMSPNIGQLDFVVWAGGPAPGPEVFRYSVAPNWGVGDHTVATPGAVVTSTQFYFGQNQNQTNVGMRWGLDTDCSYVSSWIRAPTCGAGSFVLVESLGFPGNFVMSVSVDGGPLPLELQASAAAGGEHCVGACCLNDGTCQIMTSQECARQVGCGRAGAGFQGEATTCTPNPCTAPPALGACCDPSGVCFVVNQVICLAQGMTYEGDGLTCNPDPCPQPTQNRGCDGIIWAHKGIPGPPARFGHQMVFDIEREEMVLFGGRRAAGMRFGDTWTYDGNDWKLKSTTGPSPRTDMAMAYDYDRKCVVLFGGHDGTSALGDTWEWDGSTWSQVATTGPDARHLSAMTYDANLQRVVLFGGEGSVYYTDTWEWDGSTWIQKFPGGVAPVPRSGHSMTYDEANRITVLFGGTNGSTEFLDTYAYDGATWEEPNPNGLGPHSPRLGARLVFDARCSQVMLHGPDEETWQWNGISWQAFPTVLPPPRSGFAMAYDVIRDRGILFGGLVDGDPVCETWEWRCACDNGVVLTDSLGNPIVPSWSDTTVVYAEIDSVTGYVDDIYGSYDTDTNTWYPRLLCDPAIGGYVPDSANFSCDDSLRLALGDPTVTCEEFAALDSTWQETILTQEMQHPDSLALLATRSAAPYDTTMPPHSPTDPEGCYIFGGRDIVFVHGLQTKHLSDEIFGLDLGAFEKWQHPTQFPASIENPEFYGPNGYYHTTAVDAWEEYIDTYFRSRGILNRYILISWSGNQRIRFAADAMLAQIGDAMTYGRGVINPANPADTLGFGSPSYVIISHCQGALVTDIALAAAVRNPALQAEHIARYCKGHISYDGNYGGSRYATTVLAISNLIPVQPSWICTAVNLVYYTLGQRDEPFYFDCSVPTRWKLAQSTLVDIVPAVTQWLWGPYMDDVPVKDIEIVNGHPTFIAPFKWILNQGFDDGVNTINSHTANPNSVFLWPSGFRPKGWPGVVAQSRVFDMGIIGVRGVHYFFDQVSDRRFNTLNNFAFPGPLVAGGATPYVSPTGMVQPVGYEYALNNGFNPLRRRPNHYTYIQGAADHFGIRTGEYKKSFGIWDNKEETLVITDPSIFAPVHNPHNDHAPLLTRNDIPDLKESVRGRKFKICRKCKTRWWWKRTYHLLDGWDVKRAPDYVHETILADPLGIICPPRPSGTWDALPSSFSFELSAPSPNPTRGATTLYAVLPQEGQFEVVVHDVAGRVVRRLLDGWQPAGEVMLKWDGRDERGRKAAAGLYYVRTTFRGLGESNAERRAGRIVVLR